MARDNHKLLRAGGLFLPRLATRSALLLRAPRQRNTATATSPALTEPQSRLARKKCNTHRARAVLPNPSLKLTHYGVRCLPASGAKANFPCAGKQHTPPRSA